jgi:hypothetical protein
MAQEARKRLQEHGSSQKKRTATRAASAARGIPRRIRVCDEIAIETRGRSAIKQKEEQENRQGGPGFPGKLRRPTASAPSVFQDSHRAPCTAKTSRKRNSRQQPIKV